MAPSRHALPAGTLALCAFAAAAATGDDAATAKAIAAARRARVPRAALEEAALTTVLFAGYPAGLESLRVLSREWPGRGRARDRGTRAAWRRAGARFYARVYGPAGPRLLAVVRGLHPDLVPLMLEHGYGRVLSRRGLAPRERELVAVAALAAGGWSRQLVSHLLGAQRVGATLAQAEAAALAGAARGGAAARRTVRADLRRLRAAGSRVAGRTRPG